MNKNYLRQVFGHADSGYGYKYTGEIPNNVNIDEFVTSRYVDLTKDNYTSTMVSWSNQFKCAFFYVASQTVNESISSEFEVIDDLTPPLPEVVEEESVEEPDANTVSETTSE